MLSLGAGSEFLNLSYKHCMRILVTPVFANTTGEAPSKETSQPAQLLGLIGELQLPCVEHHSYHTKNCTLHKELLRRSIVLMRSKFTFFVRRAVWFMRRIVGLKDEFYNRCIINGNLPGSPVDLLDSTTSSRSACTGLERYSNVLKKVECVQTLKSSRLCVRPWLEGTTLRGAGAETPVARWCRGATLGTAIRGVPLGAEARCRRDPRQLDEGEELSFNEAAEEKEELEGLPAASRCQAGQKRHRVAASLA
ncbi:hypothetical protein HPB48_018043 [Haemaphysalis longicornis]|uniref:Serine/threonine-protein phosphatase 4 regulatory subunit 3-like central domain-containing protein n=1 Tax=Haemaphysalis longicornis TaxID=44386 RepID=A0A9J6FHU8_HAELO|nr:hypothetical protein HPB48_018043 [Haemaphysalis longicornis]